MLHRYDIFTNRHTVHNKFTYIIPPPRDFVNSGANFAKNILNDTETINK